jgi:hypothetical protein
MSFFKSPATFLEITPGAGGDEVRPAVFSTAMPGNYVVDRKLVASAATVLAGVVITPEDFTFGQSYVRTGTLDHIPQADNGRPWIGLADRLDETAPILQQLSFASEQKSHGSLG